MIQTAAGFHKIAISARKDVIKFTVYFFNYLTTSTFIKAAAIYS